MNKQLAVRFTDGEYDALQRYARDTERTLAQVVRYAVKQLVPPSDSHPTIEDDIAVMAEPSRREPRTGESSIQRILREAKESENDLEADA